MNKPYYIIVVGGGLAGLATAYELSKLPKYRVTLLEQRDRVGGRVHSESVAGKMVDFGGFIIYPWYTNYHRILNELNLVDMLEPVPLQEIYYQVDDSGTMYLDKQLPFPKKDTAVLTVKMAKSVLQASDVAEPPLDTFDYMTGAEYFRSALGRDGHAGVYESYTDTVNQGYCYPGVERFKMAFMAPFIRMTRFSGSVADSFYIKSGNNQLPLAMADAIQRAGSVIQLNTTVSGCSGTVVHTNTGDVTGDAVVFAQTVTESVYQSVLPDVSVPMDYTSYYTLTVKLSGQPAIQKDYNWGGAFYLPNHEPLQIVSAVNLHVLYAEELAGYINLNIVIRDQAASHPLSAEVLAQRIQPELKRLFPQVELQHVLNVVYWPQTMPVSDEVFVGTIRQRQGSLGHYFAGDFLGAPSMETALTTGVRAAERVIADTSGQYQKNASSPLYQKFNERLNSLLPNHKAE
jgi:protoporphyrinogen oxidase